VLGCVNTYAPDSIVTKSEPEAAGAATAGSETGRRIADGALALFVAQGFAATSVRDIAASVGLSVPALYYHFGSKDGLLGALVEPLISDGEALLDRLAVDVDLPADEWAAQALAGYYDAASANLEVFRLVVADLSVRSHGLAGRRLADQAAQFLMVLVGEGHTRNDLIRVNAALGALRRPLRMTSVDVVDDRPQILASAQAALMATA